MVVNLTIVLTLAVLMNCF